MKEFNIPNSLTVGRILLIPVFVTLIEYEKYDFGLYVFAAAAATDMLDGLLARARNQRTRFGATLDPLADKFMLVTSYVFLTRFGWIPPWLTIIVLSRDIMIVSGCILLYFTTDNLKIEPSVPGKLSTAVQFVLVFYVLLDVNYGFPPQPMRALVWLTAFMTSLSGLHYIYRGLRISGEK